jgi:hypothetical protein
LGEDNWRHQAEDDGTSYNGGERESLVKREEGEMYERQGES